MNSETKKLIKLASTLQNKYLEKFAKTGEEIKTIISNHAKSSGRYIPRINNVDFVTLLERINRNATIDIKFESSFFGGATFEVTPFVFEEGTPESEQVMFRAIPEGIARFLNAQGTQLGIKNGRWRITFP